MDSIPIKKLENGEVFDDGRVLMTTQSVQKQYLYKFIIGGDGAVGKTTLIDRIINGRFQENHAMTIGVDFKLYKTEYHGDPVTLQIWDLGGQEQFHKLHQSYCFGALGAVVMYDLTRHITFEHIADWIELINTGAKTPIPIIVVGAKADLVDQNHIDKYFGDLHNQNLPILQHIVTSAKTGLNIGELVSKIIDAVWQKKNAAN
jgi:Ras-related protein Rab-11A